MTAVTIVKRVQRLNIFRDHFTVFIGVLTTTTTIEVHGHSRSQTGNNVSIKC